MRLHTDPRSVVDDTVAQGISLLASITTLSMDARDTMRHALAELAQNETDPVHRLLSYVQRVYRRLACGEQLNPLALLMRGLDAPETDAEINLDSFLGGVHGDSLTDMRKGKRITANAGRLVPASVLEKFTPDLHPLAHSLLTALMVDLQTRLGDEYSEGSCETELLASGMLPVLVEAVVNEGSAGMEAFPEELLLELYRDSLLPGIPKQGCYGMYRSLLATAANSGTGSS